MASSGNLSPTEKKTSRTQILVCFDNARGKWIEKAIKEGSDGNMGASQASYTHGGLPQLVEAVARVYDNAL
jgi:hypothetical protein